jgi:hypothetical protein
MIKVTGLAAASSYEFRVAAVNRVGTGINTDPYGPVFTLAAPGAPGVPSQVVISNLTRSSVVVSWNAPAYADATEISDYTIQYRKASEMSWITFIHTPSTATTAMVTVIQSRLEPEVRGRVMALWFMAFGGTVPLGNLLFGPLIDRHGSQWLLLLGSAWALFLARWCDIKSLDEAAIKNSTR